jgi:hypothetical protein
MKMAENWKEQLETNVSHLSRYSLAFRDITAWG